MKYKFKITDKKTGETTEKEAMSYKKLLKSLITAEPKWSGSIKYTNKKQKDVIHFIRNGRKYNTTVWT